MIHFGGDRGACHAFNGKPLELLVAIDYRHLSILSYLILSCLVLSCLVLSYLILSYLIYLSIYLFPLMHFLYLHRNFRQDLYSDWLVSTTVVGNVTFEYVQVPVKFQWVKIRSDSWAIFRVSTNGDSPKWMAYKRKSH